MNYIDMLTKEEKSTLCEIITGKEFKELFKANEREFTKIQKGFRAKSLTVQRALSIARTNIEKPFIASWVNMRVEQWMKEIKENIAELEQECFSHSAALATTMLDSFFANNIELYFKLTGNPLDADACSYFYERMEDIKSEREKTAKLLKQINDMEEENRSLSEQVNEEKRSIDIIKTECEKRVREIEQDNYKLTSLLGEAQAKISELQTAPITFTMDDSDYLAQFDDTDTSVLPLANADEFISLCEVNSDYSGRKYLKRYADLNHDGCYYIFHKNEDIPLNFTNRDKIFCKDFHIEDGLYGIWTWSAVPNKNDSSKDYIQSQYNTKIDAIELVAIEQTKKLDELGSILKNGLEFEPHSNRVMFYIHAFKGQYIGILCATKELNTFNGKTTISENCNEVPVYEFTDNDIIHLDNGLSFYRKAFAGIPSKLYHLKKPIEIVKNIVFSSISWNTYKTREVTRNEYRTFKSFINAIPVDDIVCKIGAACHCSNPAAKELLDDFLNVVYKYVDGDSLEDEIILSAISANIDLQNKTKDLIRKDWETENKSQLKEAQDKIKSLNYEIKIANKNLSDAQEAFDKTKAENERLSGIIAQKEKLAEDVEKTVEERIKKARENVADFIANMAFVSGQQVQATGETPPISGEATSEADMNTYCMYPEFENLDSIEAHHSWEDVIDTAVFELAEAGVADQYRRGLAAFLCAAYIEKQPLLLVGPNAIDIVQAFSAAVTAHKHGVLYCGGNYVRQMIEKMGNYDEDIVIINNLLASGWMNRLPEILSKQDIFFVATHPYAEDIQVEPKSLYGFMLPLFTDFFVDKKATGKHYGGYFADDFIKYNYTNRRKRKEIACFSKFAISLLVRSKINSLVYTMHDIYPDATTDDDFLFCIFPIAYASMAINELSEVIADSQNGIAISANLKRNLRYVLGEI